MGKVKNSISARKHAFLNALFVLLALIYIALYVNKELVADQIGSALAVLATLTLLTYIFIRISYQRPIQELGKFVKTLHGRDKDEVLTLIESHTSLQTTINSATALIGKIGKGELEEAYTVASDDELGYSIVSMREHLKKISTQEKERIWVSEGLAKFSELLRANDTDLQALCLDVLSHLVKYIDANQGAIFVIQDAQEAEEHMELVACYAYNKKKFLHKKIVKGEGLAGQAWIEQDTIFITDVPQEYISITSGLGKSSPRCLLIVPLKVNDDVYGVMELASFSLIPDYQVEFIEKLAENLASTLSMVKVNERTRQLLEESQQLTEQMRAQEEEMRQNLEELSATQEDLQRKEAELDRKLREALEKIEMGQVHQQMNEIALQIEHSVDSCKRDLKFLSNVPPVQGLIRAMANNNFDSQSNSSYESWIERMDTIFRNFLLNKELFQSITFTNEKGKVTFALHFRGKDLILVQEGDTLSYADQEVYSSTSKMQKAQVYVGQMKSLADHTLIMEFGIPVFDDEQVFKGTILVNLYADTIIDGLKAKEDGEHKYGLFTSEGLCVYGSALQFKDAVVKKKVVTNQKQQLSLTIMHQ